jgi:DNA-binding MarR family transcriptional regulator
MARGDAGVTITLTNAQIAKVVGDAAAQNVGVPVLLAHMGVTSQLTELADFEKLRRRVRPHMSNEELSRTMLRALLVLAALPASGDAHDLSDIASRVGLPLPTTYRYLATWLTAGLVEQQPRSRRYRRVAAQTRSTRKAGGG